MSIKKIREMTGFSCSTISRVLNGKSQEFRISEGTRRAILEAAEKINYRPSILARSLRLKKTMTIGLIVPDIMNPFFGELSWMIERSLWGHGFSTIICNSKGVPKNEGFYLRVLVDRQVDGILIAPAHTREWKELENVSQKTAVVLLVRMLYETDLPWVTSDNKGAAEALTSELVELGHSRIAFLGGRPGSYIDSARFVGYREALEKSGLPVEDRLVLHKDFTIEAGEAMMRTLLSRIPDISAVLCINNLVFLGAMKVVHQHEAKTRKPIMLAAFDIDRHSGLFRRPLLSANQDMESLADAAVSLLLHRINGRPVKDGHVTVPVRIDQYRV
jgi:LacI family transcriptional regulator